MMCVILVAGWLILTRLYVITASVILVIYAVVNHGDMAGRAAPAPAPGPDAPAPSPAASHDAAAAFVTMFLSAKYVCCFLKDFGL